MKRQIVAVFIMILLGISFYFYLDNKTKPAIKTPAKYEQLLSHDLDNQYPTTPKEVIGLYQEITKYLYSQKIKSEEIEPLIIMERKLFHSDLLDLNPKEVQIIKAEADIKTNKEANIKIIDFLLGESEYEIAEIAIVKAIQYLSGSDNRYLKYYLKKENEQWKILAWETVNKFTLPEE